jgi:hypothetical protein
MVFNIKPWQSAVGYILKIGEDRRPSLHLRIEDRDCAARRSGPPAALPEFSIDVAAALKRLLSAYVDSYLERQCAGVR